MLIDRNEHPNSQIFTITLLKYFNDLMFDKFNFLLEKLKLAILLINVYYFLSLFGIYNILVNFVVFKNNLSKI